MATNIQKVKQFAVYVDKTKNGGNGNGYVDGDEVSVFQKKCKTAGIKDVDKILEDYNNNRVQYESEYDKNGTKSNSSIEHLSILSLSIIFFISSFSFCASQLSKSSLYCS